MNSRGAQQALVPGRMVITLNQRSGLPELGVVCGTPSASPSALGAAAGLSAKSSTDSGSLQPISAPSTGPCLCVITPLLDNAACGAPFLCVCVRHHTPS